MARPKPIDIVRSGRFTFADASGTSADEVQQRTVIQGKSNAFYRFFNSGNTLFSIKPRGSTSSAIDVKIAQSVDLLVDGNKGAIVTSGHTDAVTGIYEYLDAMLPVRSGRFKIMQNANVAQTIIHLEGGSDRAWYRIFNSGDHPIVIEGARTSPRVLHVTQSYDFEVGPSDREITVKSEQANQPIEGIYEFLGREE